MGTFRGERATGVYTPGVLLGGKYTLIERAGSGGTGEVWRAELRGAAGFRRTVAVKRVFDHVLGTESLRAMFIEEARVASLLDQPNVVQVFDFGEDDEGLYLVMEWVEGMSLRDFLDVGEAQGVRPSPALVAAIGIETLRALEAAHSHMQPGPDGTPVPCPIVHRDVSPSNVLLSVRGVVKLADFGFARAFDRSTMTPQGFIKGKLRYLSPEQAHGAPASPRSDLYSCAVLLWEALCGGRLYGEATDGQIARMLIEKRPHPSIRSIRPDVPEIVAAPVDRALSIDPSHRQASALEFARDLRDALRRIPEHTDERRISAEVRTAMALRRASETAPATPVERSLSGPEIVLSTEPSTVGPILDDRHGVPTQDRSSRPKRRG